MQEVAHLSMPLIVHQLRCPCFHMCINQLFVYYTHFITISILISLFYHAILAVIQNTIFISHEAIPMIAFPRVQCMFIYVFVSHY